MKKIVRKSLRLTPEINQKLQQIAKRTLRTETNVIEWLINEYEIIMRKEDMLEMSIVEREPDDYEIIRRKEEILNMSIVGREPV